MATPLDWTREDAERFIASQEWRYAKTRPRNPHYYCVRGKGNTDAEFEALIHFIFRHGIYRTWGGKLYVHWMPGDGWRYWTMGWPMAEEVTINRAHEEEDQSTFTPDWSRTYRFMSKDGGIPPALRTVIELGWRKNDLPENYRHLIRPATSRRYSW